MPYIEVENMSLVTKDPSTIGYCNLVSPRLHQVSYYRSINSHRYEAPDMPDA